MFKYWEFMTDPYIKLKIDRENHADVKRLNAQIPNGKKIIHVFGSFFFSKSTLNGKIIQYAISFPPISSFFIGHSYFFATISLMWREIFTIVWTHGPVAFRAPMIIYFGGFVWRWRVNEELFCMEFLEIMFGIFHFSNY